MSKYFEHFMILIVFLLGSLVKSDTMPEVQQKVLSTIFKNYDPRIRPAGKNNTYDPVVVYINTFVRSIRNVDDFKMAYDTQLTFRMKWQDPRLEFNETGINYVSLTDQKQLWTPDIFFSNELSGHFHEMLLPNVLIRIYPDGGILFSTRISLHLSCPMSLVNYPLDNQVCSLVLASYGYTTQDVELVWKNYVPVQVTKNLFMSQFKFTKFVTGDCTSRTNTGAYSCLKIDFFLTRNFYNYLLQIYMPTASMVLLSWLVFWLNPKYTNIRFGIILGILISLIIITNSINNHTPQVSYAKAVDVWIGVCFCFLFGSIIEICVVANVFRKEEYSRLPDHLTTDELLKDNSIRTEDGGKSSKLGKFKSTTLKWLKNFTTTAQIIDIFSRFLFPALFAIFNLIYWMKYAATE